VDGTLAGLEAVVIGTADDPGVDPRALREAVITATTPGRATRTPDLTGAATTRALLETLVGD
jgi:hypothetical protein